MNYTEVQIRQADIALKLLHDAQGFVDGHKLWQTMGTSNAEYMRYQVYNALINRLKLYNHFRLKEYYIHNIF